MMSKNNLSRSLVITIILISISPSLILDAKGENLESIYIKEDGTIEPPTIPMTRDENTYTLTGDLINYFLYIQKAGITIDGAGYKLQGNTSGATGILVYRDNTTIKNIQVSQYGTGILLASINNTVTTSTIIHNSNGISMDTLTNQNIVGNTISENNNGIDITGSHYPFNLDENWIAYNNITHNTFGIQIFRSSENNIIQNNIFLDNYVGVNLKSSTSLFFSNNFLRNEEHVRVDYLVDQDESSSVCSWDNSMVGNFWDDYFGEDQNQDGRGDMPYEINQVNQDGYPLMVSISDSKWIFEYRGFYIQKVRDDFIVSEYLLETYISPLFTNVEEAKDWIDSGPTSTPKPTTEFPTTITIGVIAVLVVVVGLGIFVYFKKYRK